jgi:hypothetical protein
MKCTSFVIASAIAAAPPVTAAASGDPLAQSKADLPRLTTDASPAASTVAADVEAGNLAQLRRDATWAHVTLKADWKLLSSTQRLARKAGGDGAAMRSLLMAARTQTKGFRSAARSAFTQAKQAAKQNTGSNGPRRSRDKGKPAGRGSDEEGSGG